MAQARASIVFGLPEQDKGNSKLEEEREKHRTRHVLLVRHASNDSLEALCRP